MPKKRHKLSYNFITMLETKFSIERLARMRITQLEEDNRSLRSLCETYQRFLEARDRVIKRLKQKGKR